MHSLSQRLLISVSIPLAVFFGVMMMVLDNGFRELADRSLQQLLDSQMVALIAAANRDPEVFDHPDRLDIGRRDNRHLSFGGGIHHCLGAPLARIEGQEAIGRLIRRFPDLALAEPEIEWKPTSTIRGPKRLTLVW